MRFRTQCLACFSASTLLTLVIACGIAVHNEITYRSLERFKPRARLEETYKDDIMSSPGYTQAGSFFPDWGYQCLGNDEQAEDAHWPTFIKTAINYIRETYAVSQFHTDPHVKGLIAFVFAIMSHGMADVQWHGLRGLDDFFIVALANSDFHGNLDEAHLAADTGAEFTLRHSTRLSYLNETWHVPIKDIIEIYKRLYSTTATAAAQNGRRVPLASHIQYCMTAAFAASRIDVEFGRYMFGYYGSKSPFLVEETLDYYKGGISQLSGTVADCYTEVVNAFEQGVSHQQPDTLCAGYFRTATAASPSSKQHCTKYYNISSVNSLQNDAIVSYYDVKTGVLTLTMKEPLPTTLSSNDATDNDRLPALQRTTGNIDINEENWRSRQYQQWRQQPYQRPFQNPVTHSIHTNTDTSSTVDNNNRETTKKFACSDVFKKEEYAAITVTLLSEPNSQLGHQVVEGNFLTSNGDGENNKTTIHLAISAPYYQQTGAVFIVRKEDLISLSTSGTSQNGRKNIKSVTDIQELAHTILKGDVQHGRFGWSVTTMDINQDGSDDLIVSSPFGDTNDNREGGKIEIYLSLPAKVEGKGWEKKNKRAINFRKIELCFPAAAASKSPLSTQEQQSQFPSSVLGTVLLSVEEPENKLRQGNNSRYLVAGCPLCSFSSIVGKDLQYRHQTGRVYVFESNFLSHTEPFENRVKITKEPDLFIENPNRDEDNSNYDHFGESILFMQKTGILLIGAPGYSTKNKQRVGRVYAFDMKTNKLKWIVTGSVEFQQYGKVLASNADQTMLVVSSPSEETRFKYHQRYWQAGTVRVYDWNRIISNFDDKQGLQAKEEQKPIEFDTDQGMNGILLGRTNAGHLGQSLFMSQQKLWVGEPMSDQENGRVYIWSLENGIQGDDNLKCLKTSQRRLERFGSHIGPLVSSKHNNADIDNPFICIASQRFGQNNDARYTGAINCFLEK